MSRIHEALKKAERERALSQAAAAVAPALVSDPAEEAIIPEPATAHITAELPLSLMNSPAPAAKISAVAPGAPSVLSAAVSEPQYLRFDDLRAQCAHPLWQLDPRTSVFANSGVPSHAAEQFRTLRSRLYQLRASQPMQKVLVTSSVPAEGKTFVAANLAQAIVRQPDRRALLIDADLRCSRLHVPLGAPIAPGLTDYLRGEAGELEIIQLGNQGNLCLIPGGSEVSNPSELLLNGRLKTLLARLAPVFDWIILDSPPCLPVADASSLADLCDGVLFVVKGNSTPAEVCQKSLQVLAGRQIAGVVLNAIQQVQAYGAYDYYYSGGYPPSRRQACAKA